MSSKYKSLNTLLKTKTFLEEIFENTYSTMEYTGISSVINYDKLTYHIPCKSKEREISDILVSNSDTFEISKYLIDNGFNPLVLNMTSAEFITSGFDYSQESELFRRSNLYKSLETDYYPLKSNQGILSPLVHVFKDINYNLITPFSVDIVSISAINHPLLTENGEYVHENDKTLMANKIDGIFKIALNNGNDSLVLSAFGCGQYRNPSKEVAKLFLECIIKYRQCFRMISFGILGKNYTIFNSVLSSLNKF